MPRHDRDPPRCDDVAFERFLETDVDTVWMYRVGRDPVVVLRLHAWRVVDEERDEAGNARRARNSGCERRLVRNQVEVGAVVSRSVDAVEDGPRRVTDRQHW